MTEQRETGTPQQVRRLSVLAIPEGFETKGSIKPEDRALAIRGAVFDFRQAASGTSKKREAGERLAEMVGGLAEKEGLVNALKVVFSVIGNTMPEI